MYTNLEGNTLKIVLLIWLQNIGETGVFLVFPIPASLYYIEATTYVDRHLYLDNSGTTLQLFAATL